MQNITHGKFKNIMQEQLITFTTSVLAKDKGFDWSTKHYYDLDKDLHSAQLENHNKNPLLFSVASQTILQLWLRKNYQIYLQILLVDEFDPIAGWIYKLTYITYPKKVCLTKMDNCMSFPTYEDALEFGLMDSLSVIK